MEGLLYDFRNWVTDEEEVNAYAKIFFNQNFPDLPRDIISIIRKKVWIHEFRDLIGRRRIISWGLQCSLNAHYEYLFLSGCS